MHSVTVPVCSIAEMTMVRLCTEVFTLRQVQITGLGFRCMRVGFTGRISKACARKAWDCRYLSCRPGM